MVPSNWLRGIVTPIPKGSDKDPSAPLNYCGISLSSSVQKVYSSIINARLTNYLEATDILVDEQNGFRKGRACIDHVYALSATIRNRLETGKNIFATFVDIKKAFYWVDRDLLFISC